MIHNGAGEHRLGGHPRQSPLLGVGVGSMLRMLVLVIVLALFGPFLAACSSTPAVRASNQMTLVKDGPYSGAHRTMDYRVEFTYTFQAGKGAAADSMQFEGRVVPRRGLDTFLLRLHFLDGDGQVLGTTILYAPGARRGAGRPSISRTIDVPPGAAKIGFSHVAREQRVLPGRR